MYPQERGERWYKFAADADGQYTIMTRGASDTVGYLYNGYGYPLQRNDDHGDGTNFKIITTLKAGNIYYLKIKQKDEHYSKFEIFVADGIYPDSVTVEPKELTLGSGQESSISVEISPANVTDLQFFGRTNRDLIEITGVTDSTGPNPDSIYKTITFKALNPGLAYVRAIAKGRHDIGKFADCDVTVYFRENVTVMRDGNFNKIVFNSSGKVWYCINYDMIDNLNNASDDVLQYRLYMNTYENVTKPYHTWECWGLKTYTADEMRLLYTIDPYGFANYVQEYASKKPHNHVGELIACKNEIFTVLFNKIPQYFARNDDGSWYVVPDINSFIKDWRDWNKVLSESEALFGTHPIYDGVTWRDFKAVLVNLVGAAFGLSKLFVESASKGAKILMKIIKLSYEIDVEKAENENDLEGYINALDSATESEAEEKALEKYKSNNYEMDWAKSLITFSESLGALAQTISEKPNFYKEVFEHCAENPNYRVFFEFQNGDIYEIKDVCNYIKDIA